MDRNPVEYGTLITGDENVAVGDAAVQTADESVRTTAETVVTPVLTLELAAETLAVVLGPLVDADYVQGKTQFRDVLCERFDLSQLEAEELVDGLERSGRISFLGADVEERRGWHVQHGAGAR
ncbi:hypothetical protein SOCE26_084480 [Sorangium cellulosum]|uniref:Uncharacterized protein n=1 Tax=Sorangium cellulosum TaxID=56 RepID=A0A2L0F5S0_SORCE|nr:hypothetical protein [Sorangium cellulosum]AUX46938.1 hypothetical protein SOCE26_084480 [Sorangium cellulosum]